MKKNLLYLWALVCSLTLFAACSSDDDDSDNKNNENPPEEEAVITAPDVIGTHRLPLLRMEYSAWNQFQC